MRASARRSPIGFRMTPIPPHPPVGGRTWNRKRHAVAGVNPSRERMEHPQILITLQLMCCPSLVCGSDKSLRLLVACLESRRLLRYMLAVPNGDLSGSVTVVRVITVAIVESAACSFKSTRLMRANVPILPMGPFLANVSPFLLTRQRFSSPPVAAWRRHVAVPHGATMRAPGCRG